MEVVPTTKEHLEGSSAACCLHIDAEVRGDVSRQSRGGTMLGLIVGACRGGTIIDDVYGRHDHFTSAPLILDKEVASGDVA